MNERASESVSTRVDGWVSQAAELFCLVLAVCTIKDCCVHYQGLPASIYAGGYAPFSSLNSFVHAHVCASVHSFCSPTLLPLQPASLQGIASPGLVGGADVFDGVGFRYSLPPCMLLECLYRISGYCMPALHVVVLLRLSGTEGSVLLPFSVCIVSCWSAGPPGFPPFHSSPRHSCCALPFTRQRVAA